MRSEPIAQQPATARPTARLICGALLAASAPTAHSLPVISGSNPNLTEETSNSWTVGAVIQPRFIPGLSLSVDYYNIKVKTSSSR